MLRSSVQRQSTARGANAESRHEGSPAILLAWLLVRTDSPPIARALLTRNAPDRPRLHPDSASPPSGERSGPAAPIAERSAG